jgi:DNA-binding CsgD family transcriptional regulator
MGDWSSARLLCPELVGRDDEAALLVDRVEALGRGRGGVVALVGEAGVGKSRLVREVTDAAAGRGVAVLAGRAVPGPNPVPYRPLTEAFLGAFRSVPRPTAPELAGLGGQLGRLVPAWREPGVDDSPLLLGEAVLRLLSRHGERGCVLVLEDLHWADAETLAALDHLGDAAVTEPVLCVCTARPAGTAAETLERLELRDPASTIRLGPLTSDDVDRMVAACLGTAATPPGLAAFVRSHGDGTPFLVEELLAGLVSSGSLHRTGLGHDAGWALDGALTPTVPASLRESVRRRLSGLTPTDRRVIGAAALLGRRFEWELLPGVAEVDGRTAADALRAAVDAQLLDTDGDGFAFRHSLTREAVLGDLLPPDRRHLARRAWDAVERSRPGLPGAACEQAAELAEAAGDPAGAAERLVESARRARDAGALVSAEATARRATDLAPAEVAPDAGEMLVRVLVAAGKPAQARTLGLGLVPGLAPGRRADLLAVLARAALASGDPAAAEDDIAAARAALAADPDPAVGARVDAAAAFAALDRGRPADAAALADVALAGSRGQPEVECEALEVRGRVARVTDIDAGRAWFQRAADAAERAGLAAWHLRAQHELALLAWPSGDMGPLRETRDLAARYGALVTVAVMDLSLADVALVGWDRAGCLAAAAACAEASRRFGLATEPVAQLWLAGAHALAGDDAAMDAAAAQALARDPADPRILGDLHGRVLATRCLVADDLAGLRAHLDTMMEYVRVADPATSVFPGRVLWATLHAIGDDDLGAAARAEYSGAADASGMAQFLGYGDAVEAVALGRAGDAGGATELMTRARERLRGSPLGQGMTHAQQMLVADAARRDGWGDPVAWLRECEAFFAAGGYDRTARRCRLLLAGTGAPVPRRGRGASAVPATLRALGVTSREVDVLRLVVDGLSSREIGQRLYLSPRTVERHIGSLFDRTGVRDRAALREVARAHDLQTG